MDAGVYMMRRLATTSCPRALPPASTKNPDPWGTGVDRIIKTQACLRRAISKEAKPKPASASVVGSGVGAGVAR